MESSYQLRSISERTHYADGTDVTDGPNVSSSFPLGWYKEDFDFIDGSGDLDEHNGRFSGDFRQFCCYFPVLISILIILKPSIMVNWDVKCV